MDYLGMTPDSMNGTAFSTTGRNASLHELENALSRLVATSLWDGKTFPPFVILYNCPTSATTTAVYRGIFPGHFLRGVPECTPGGGLAYRKSTPPTCPGSTSRHLNADLSFEGEALTAERVPRHQTDCNLTDIDKCHLCIQIFPQPASLHLT